jgi:hypothetical protein
MPGMQQMSRNDYRTLQLGHCQVQCTIRAIEEDEERFYIVTAGQIPGPFVADGTLGTQVWTTNCRLFIIGFLQIRVSERYCIVESFVQLARQAASTDAARVHISRR